MCKLYTIFFPLGVWLASKKKKLKKARYHVLTNVIAGNDVAHVGLMEYSFPKIVHCTKQVHHSVGNLRLKLTREYSNVTREINERVF